jgi:hypothetical protein
MKKLTSIKYALFLFLLIQPSVHAVVSWECLIAALKPRRANSRVEHKVLLTMEGLPPIMVLSSTGTLPHAPAMIEIIDAKKAAPDTAWLKIAAFAYNGFRANVPGFVAPFPFNQAKQTTNLIALALQKAKAPSGEVNKKKDRVEVVKFTKFDESSGGGTAVLLSLTLNNKPFALQAYVPPEGPNGVTALPTIYVGRTPPNVLEVGP